MKHDDLRGLKVVLNDSSGSKAILQTPMLPIKQLISGAPKWGPNASPLWPP